MKTLKFLVQVEFPESVRPNGDDEEMTRTLLYASMCSLGSYFSVGEKPVFSVVQEETHDSHSYKWMCKKCGVAWPIRAMHPDCDAEIEDMFLNPATVWRAAR